MAGLRAVAWRIGVSGALAVPALAGAQTIAPSQVVPRDFRPQPLDAARDDTPAGDAVRDRVAASALAVTVGSVSVDGSLAGQAAADRAQAATIAGLRIGIGDLYRTATAIEAGYARAGYPLVRVVVPPQRLVDGGAVRLLVVDGFVERIDVDAVPAAVRRLVAARLAPLVGRPSLRGAMLERRLLLAGDLPGLRLRTTLRAGKATGATVLVVEAVRRPIEARVDIANMLGDALGRVQIGTTLIVNDLFGTGEQAYATLSGGADPYTSARLGEPLRIFGGGVVVPIGLDGWTFNPEWSVARTSPERRPGVLATRGDFTRATLRTSYPLVRRRHETLTLSATIDATREANRASDFAIDLFRDRYRAARVGVAWDRATIGLGGAPARFTAAATLSQGLGGRNAATATRTRVPLSRVGAAPDFTTLAAVLRTDQALPGGAALTIAIRGQTGFGQALLRAEQGFLDGADAVSSAPSGSFAVDRGLTVRGEIGRPFAAAAGRIRLSPYVFAAAGAGGLARPTALEPRRITASAWGFGLRGSADAAIAPIFALELGRRTAGPQTLPDGWRMNVHATLRY